MITKRMKPSGKFILKVLNKSLWLKRAGTRHDATGVPETAAVTTANIRNAQRFKTYSQAERMRDILHERYGMASQIMAAEE